MRKLKLTSPKWAELSHAYSNASDLPDLIARLRSVSLDDWDAVYQELVSAIVHQGDIYTATYATVPHLVQYADELGPCKQSDDLLSAVADSSHSLTGPEVPEFLEDSWEDAQEHARDLILERLIAGQVSESNAGILIYGLLDLSGEWKWAEYVVTWVGGGSIHRTCEDCGYQQDVHWHDGRVRMVSHVVLSTEPGITPDDDLEFEDELIRRQLIGLAEATSYPIVVNQFRSLFGEFPCARCGQSIEMTPNGPDANR